MSMKRRELMFLIISIFVVAVAWITFSIYHNAVTSTISDSLSLRINPIQPQFDTATLEEYKKRKQVKPLLGIPDTENSTATPSVSPTATPTLVSPPATPSSGIDIFNNP